MSKDPFKYIRREEFEKANSPIIFYLTEEQIQEFAEDNYSPRLSEEELEDLIWDGLMHAYFDSFVYEAIRKIREKN